MGSAFVGVRLAQADDVDDYTRRLLDLDQRARVLSSELSANEAPPPADIAIAASSMPRPSSGSSSTNRPRRSCWT